MKKWGFWLATLPVMLVILLGLSAFFALYCVAIVLATPQRMWMKIHPKFLAWYDKRIP